MAGYNEILRRIEPEKIICYNTPFPEMQGNIVWTMNKGDLYETHIGPDGKADSETHYSDHGTPTLHDNPHTHDIYWDDLALTPVGLNTLGKHMAEKGDGFL